MESVKRHKIWTVSLLSALFALPFVVKSVHVYRAEQHAEHNCSSHKPHPHHDCNDCPICQFTLSVFTEATAVYHDFRVIHFDFEPNNSIQNKPYQQVFIPYGLRAPPAA